MPKDRPDRILIIRLSSIGDIVLTSPLVRALRQRFPHARIDFLVRSDYADLVRYNPHLSRVLIYDPASGWSGLRELRRQIVAAHYDVVLDIHRNWRSIYLRRGRPVLKVKKYYGRRWLLVYLKMNRYSGLPESALSVAGRYLMAAAPLGISTHDLRLECFVPEEVQRAVAGEWKRLVEKGVRVIMAPGSKHFTKRWPPAHFIRLIQIIYDQLGWKTLLLGSPDERPLLRDIIHSVPDDLAMGLDREICLMEAAAFIQNASLFVSNDSGLMHIAAAFQVPQVAIFGSTTRELGFFPINPRAVVVENPDIPCRPCHHIGRSACPKSHFRCMTTLTPERVWQAIQSLIQVKPRSTDFI
ncbi:MAG: glycosyltransferase family 9 protein [Calditrichaeota bacterium]|nr:glycosyltransferase family 9 protein [Calditrichota bacterium]